jgi:HME family heavy-metal exporter
MFKYFLSLLYSVATVILGGLISSALLDMIITPVVFKQFRKKALQKYVTEQERNAFQ